MKGEDYEDRACCQSGDDVPSDSCPQFKLNPCDSAPDKETCTPWESPVSSSHSPVSSSPMLGLGSIIGIATIGGLTVILCA